MPRKEPVDVFQLYQIRGPDDCWPYIGSAWGGQEREKRPYFMANARRMIAYRWIYELVHGVTLRPNQLVLHSCDNGGYPTGCGNPSHMRLGDVQDNSNDMKARQRHGLPATVVRAIRRLLAQGTTQVEIARLYGLTREAVSSIATERAYKHVTDDGE